MKRDVAEKTVIGSCVQMSKAFDMNSIERTRQKHLVAHMACDNGEREDAMWAQHPECFREHALWSADVFKDRVGQHSADRGIRQWQRASVAPNQQRMFASRLGAREIYLRWIDSDVDGGVEKDPGEFPKAATQIENRRHNLHPLQCLGLTGPPDCERQWGFVEKGVEIVVMLL